MYKAEEASDSFVSIDTSKETHDEDGLKKQAQANHNRGEKKGEKKAALINKQTENI